MSIFYYIYIYYNIFREIILTTVLGVVLLATLLLGAIMPKFIAIIIKLKEKKHAATSENKKSLLTEHH